MPVNKKKAFIYWFIIYFGAIGIKFVFDYFYYSGIDIFTFTNVYTEFWRFAGYTFYAFAYWIYLDSLKEQKLRVATDQRLATEQKLAAEQKLLSEQKLFKAELAFLKAQINPHFMFNTLNFVYNDVARLSKKSGDAILGLTKLMRYSVESTKAEQSSVSKEIEAIDEYINLQKLRFGENIHINYTKKVGLSFFAMPPLVLLSLVENAFKYGIINDPNNPIEITLKVDSSGLEFNCKNKIRKDFLEQETTAVGLENIKRRLEFAFKDQYTLNHKETNGMYTVELSLFWNK